MASKKEKDLPALSEGALADRQKAIRQAEPFSASTGLDPNNAMTLNFMGYMFADKGLPPARSLSWRQGRRAGAP